MADWPKNTSESEMMEDEMPKPNKTEDGADIVPIKPVPEAQEVPPIPPSTAPLIVLSPHVPVAASLENTMSQSLITVRQAINDETAAMNGSQDETKRKIEAITAKARREIQELEETQADADAAHAKRLEDLRVAEDMLTKGLEPAERAREARIAKERDKESEQ